jgi:hypothetical protein
LAHGRAHVSPPVLFSGKKSCEALPCDRQDHVQSDLKCRCP